MMICHFGKFNENHDFLKKYRKNKTNQDCNNPAWLRQAGLQNSPRVPKNPIPHEWRSHEWGIEVFRHEWRILIQHGFKCGISIPILQNSFISVIFCIFHRINDCVSLPQFFFNLTFFAKIKFLKSLFI